MRAGLPRLLRAGRDQGAAVLADVAQLLGFGRVHAPPPPPRRRARGAGARPFRATELDGLSAARVTARLAGLTPAELRKARDHERRGANRAAVLRAIERRLSAGQRRR